ncbi:MAG: hypothetical protein GY811_00040 [Myxococcales bacterium]|nr:hypothetical protein [Myxococcales bacterium]
MDPQALGRIERLNYVLGAILMLICAGLSGTHFTLGVLTGVVLTCLNFSLVRLLVAKILAAGGANQGRAAILFVPKMSGLILAAALAVFLLPISPIGLGIGFSVFLVSIVVESIRFMTGAALLG